MKWVAMAALLAAGLAPVLAWPQSHAASQSATASTVESRQRAQVRRLEHAVAGQEAGSQSAARRLREKDARIAELQKQLQAVQATGHAPKSGP